MLVITLGSKVQSHKINFYISLKFAINVPNRFYLVTSIIFSFSGCLKFVDTIEWTTWVEYMQKSDCNIVNFLSGQDEILYIYFSFLLEWKWTKRNVSTNILHFLAMYSQCKKINVATRISFWFCMFSYCLCG